MADIVLLATSDWDHPLWTNKQHVACALAELGHRVLYVDSLGVRGPRVDRSDSGRILRRQHPHPWPNLARTTQSPTQSPQDATRVGTIHTGTTNPQGIQIQHSMAQFGQRASHMLLVGPERMIPV